MAAETTFSTTRSRIAARRKARRQRRIRLAAAVITAAVVLGLGVPRLVSAAGRLMPKAEPAQAAGATKIAAKPSPGPASRPLPPLEPAFLGQVVARRPQPTPVFATCGGVRLRLPVDMRVVTMLGFHQATSDNARQLTPVVVEKPRYGSFPIDGFAPVTKRRVPTHLLYRTGRSGTPDRACDVGAPAGTAVIAPVSGTVTELKHYSLYKVTPDVEVHIQPDGADGLEIVMIHVDGVSVREGQRVEAGLTRIGRVRRLSNILTTMQLSYYTQEAGDHVHVQVNVPSSAPGPHAGD